MALATFGTALAFWGYNNLDSSSSLDTQRFMNIAIVGTLKGKGWYSSATIDTTSLFIVITDVATTDRVFTSTGGGGNCANGICTVYAPSGGIGQFKGLI